MLGDSAISAEGDGGRTESGSGGSFWMVKMAGGNDGDGDGVKRGWDWRKGWAKESSGEDLLRVLRLALAKEISTAWIEGVRY